MVCDISRMGSAVLVYLIYRSFTSFRMTKARFVYTVTAGQTGSLNSNIKN